MTPAQRHKQQKLAKIAADRQEVALQAAAQAEARSNVPSPALAPSFPAETGGFTRPSESPAAKAKQVKLARLAVENGAAASIAPDRSENGPEASEYALLIAALGEDMARLKDIQSTESKIAAKHEMIDRYTPHVDATLAAAAETGKAVQDELLVTMMLWRLDIGDYTRGLDIADHVLRFGLRLPERFQRTPATLIAEEIAEAALATLKQDKDFDVAVLQRAASLTEAHDMPDQARAKLHKAIGLQMIRIAAAADENPETVAAGAAKASRTAALEHLRRAIALNDNIGVKKDIERLTAWLNKSASAPDETGPDESGAAKETE